MFFCSMLLTYYTYEANIWDVTQVLCPLWSMSFIVQSHHFLSISETPQKPEFLNIVLNNTFSPGLEL